MDPIIMAYILAAVAGWGSGALMVRDPTDYPPTPCPKCPSITGAVAAVLLWGTLGLSGHMAELTVPAVATGFAGGLFGGSLPGFIGALRAS